MNQILLKLYFDTTTWIRLYENLTEDYTKLEQEAIDDILDEKNNTLFEIISSKFQVDQLYTLLNSSNTSENKKDAIQKSIAQCIENTGQTTQTSPYCQQELDEFMLESKINHREDGRHIVTAWIREANYFITTDRELYKDKQIDIEKALSKMWNPLSQLHYHSH